MHIHLDPLGGVAGDMFVAAMLDAFPEYWPRVEDSLSVLGLGKEATCRLLPHGDGTLTGKRFDVALAQAHRHDHAAHTHRSWASIKQFIEGSALSAAVRARVIAIFELLARAEAKVHGIEETAVEFHEVGAVDSIIDVVAAAEVIEAVGARWTSAPLPLGSGRVRTAHGWLPVPAPATALLLEGLTIVDDGIAGERVTPTGAAILRHLLADAPAAPGHRVLQRSGFGFGTKTLPGISNCLRVLVFETSSPPVFRPRELSVIEFEVDDQTAEDLAIGLDHLRQIQGVLDVVQAPVFGKKGRLAAHIQVLALPERVEAVVGACFTETTTIGLRHQRVQGFVLPRTSANVAGGAGNVRVKKVERPDGHTAKAEADDIAIGPGHAGRARLRDRAERKVLQAPPQAEE